MGKFDVLLQGLSQDSVSVGGGEVTRLQKFRHRGFKPNDGSPDVMMFGNDPAPLNTDGTPMQKLWDNDIDQVIKVKKHVDVIVDPVPDTPPV